MKIVIRTLLGIALMIPAADSWPQNLEQIVQNHIEIRGGYEAFKNIQSFRIMGRTVRRGMETSFTACMKKPEKFRYETEFGGNPILFGFDGENAWNTISQGPSGRRGDTGATARGSRNMMMRTLPDLEGPLVDYESKGFSLEWLGNESMEGTEVIKLKLTGEDGAERFLYLDSEYYVILKETSIREFRGNTMEMETYYSDYKEVDGLMIAHTMETRMGGGADRPMGGAGSQTVIESIEINPQLDDSLFEDPARKNL
ncbi:MAG TPA: hypothetical protein ENN03_05300 [bacterium]|nr:hypothetical protein [bacterium]